jgi:hypothetical protein
VRAALADDPLSAELMDAMLSARATLWEQYCRLHDLVVKNGGAQLAVPTLHGDPRRRPGDGALVHDGDRRSDTLSPLTRRRGLLRADLATVAVGYFD